MFAVWTLKYHNSASLIHLLNIANVIPFIASLGIHFILLLSFTEKKKKQDIIQKTKKTTTWVNIIWDKLILICDCKFKAGVQRKTDIKLNNYCTKTG